MYTRTHSLTHTHVYAHIGDIYRPANIFIVGQLSRTSDVRRAGRTRARAITFGISYLMARRQKIRHVHAGSEYNYAVQFGLQYCLRHRRSLESIVNNNSSHISFPANREDRYFNISVFHNLYINKDASEEILLSQDVIIFVSTWGY